MNLFLSLFAIGLVTSIHCVFMCGGLVLTYAVKGTEEGPWYKRLVPHLAYQGAKILSYAMVAIVLGGIVALLGRTVDITPFRNWLMVVAGVYMVLLGIGMTGKVKALRHLTPRPPKFLIDALSKNRRKANADAAEGRASLATPISFGLLTGLMPCAPLIAAQASAMASGSPITGALGMIGFGLGTMPLMLLFGFASSLLSRRFQAKLQVIAAIAIVIFGGVILDRGLTIVGSPVNVKTIRTAVLGGPAPAAPAGDFKKGADGVVEIPLTIENVRFVPENLSLPVDTPVRLVVDRKEANACSAQLAIPQAGVLADLADNAVTTVNVPPLKAGTYTLTCGMGMMAGSISVGGAGSGGSGSPLTLPLALLALAAGGYAVHRRRIRVREAAAKAEAERLAAAKKNGKKSSRTKAETATSDKGEPGEKVAENAADKAAPETVRAEDGFTLWGFQPVELMIAASLVIVAVIVGLASGGMFG